MDWDERYRSQPDTDAPPTQLLVRIAQGLKPGKALDLACGTGRNAVWLAEQGWDVTAVDNSRVAIDILRRREVGVHAQVADLEKGEYKIAPGQWDLIAMCYYLQRDLLEPAFLGLAPGGVLIVIVHITEVGEEPTGHRLRPGELAAFFSGREILHSYEGQPHDASHARAVAEMAVQRG